MRTRAYAALGAIAIVVALAQTSFAADQGRKRLGVFKDWQAYTLTTGGNTVCYAIAVPKDISPKTVVRNGRRVKISRGDVYVTITNRPATETANEVNVVIGYTFRKNSRVSYTIDGRRHKLFTMDDGAWAYDSKSDSTIVRAMERGKTLVVTGTSSHGTTTKDTYSLAGFTAAHNAIDKACNVK